MNIYALLVRLFPQRPPPAAPRRIVLALPCCIGDVVLATAALQALRRGCPQAHIAWAVGSWSKGVLEGHPLLDTLLDTGPAALPVRTPVGLARFVRQLRSGQYDLLVSLVRSPLMSLAALLSGIPHRAGLDSAGRGFGYTVRVRLDPDRPRHEADIYLDVARALGLDAAGCRANIPVQTADQEAARARLAALGIRPPFLVLNPAGGRNPGMALAAKRWPPAHFAALAERLARRLGAQPLLLAGPGDEAIVAAVQAHLSAPIPAIVGGLTFGQIAGLASLAQVYIGNDTGLTHLAAAAGAPTVMIFGPSDPVRYAPFTDRSLALWQPTAVPRGGVAAGAPPAWNWARDGIGVDEVEARVIAFLAANTHSGEISTG